VGLVQNNHWTPNSPLVVVDRIFYTTRADRLSYRGTAKVVIRILWALPNSMSRSSQKLNRKGMTIATRPMADLMHTIIPTFDVQKEKDAQFMRAIGDLVAVDYLCGTVGS